MSASTTENSFSHPEPLEIQMYGSWSMSLPTWLVLQLGTYVLLLLLLVGCYQVMFPTTGLGEHDLITTGFKETVSSAGGPYAKT